MSVPYYIGPTYNSDNINSIQSSRVVKKSAEGNFEKTLQVENAKAAFKNGLNSSNNTQKVSDTANLINAKSRTSVSKNYLARTQESDVNGTNLALKELSTELAEQVVGILVTYAMNPGGTMEGGFAENFYNQEATSEKVKDVARDLIEDLSNQFYEESLRKQEVEEKNEAGNR